jgi:hypothetical protein
MPLGIFLTLFTPHSHYHFLFPKKQHLSINLIFDLYLNHLGAGQDVGRSCILVSLGGKNIMFDCGMHMGYNDERYVLIIPNSKPMNRKMN